MMVKLGLRCWDDLNKFFVLGCDRALGWEGIWSQPVIKSVRATNKYYNCTGAVGHPMVSLA
jgi:hypothetical protein